MTDCTFCYGTGIAPMRTVFDTPEPCPSCNGSGAAGQEAGVMSDDWEEIAVQIQKHRDHWRSYAYGQRERPTDYLDNAPSSRSAQTVQERQQAEIDRLRGLLHEWMLTVPLCNPYPCKHHCRACRTRLELEQSNGNT